MTAESVGPGQLIGCEAAPAPVPSAAKLPSRRVTVRPVLNTLSPGLKSRHDAHLNCNQSNLIVAT